MRLNKLMRLVGDSISVPGTPSGLAVISSGNGAIEIGSATSTGATSFDIYYSNNGGSSYTLLASSQALPYTDNAALANFNTTTGLIYYEVYGRNSIGTSTSPSNAVSASPWTIYDTFVGTSGTLLPSHTISPINAPSTAWTNQDNGHQLNGSGMAVPSNSGLCYSTVNVGNDNFYAQVIGESSIAYGSGGLLGLAPRFQDNNNNWHVALDFYGAGYGFFLEETVSGQNYLRASYAINPSNNTPYTLAVSIIGNTFTGYLNGTQAWQYTDADYNTSTLCGFRTNVTTGVTYQQFSVHL